MTKGRQGKRDGPKATGVTFCGASQPRSFLSKGVFVKLAKAGDGLYEKNSNGSTNAKSSPHDLQGFIEQLKEMGVEELSRVFDGVVTQHQSREARVYELSDRGKTAYNKYCSQVVKEQNARFQEQSAGSGQSCSSSKDTKHVLQLSVILHVLFHAIDKALGLIPPASTQTATVINEYSVDVKAVLKEVRKNASMLCY